MKQKQNKKKADYSGQTIYIGLDVHKKSLSVKLLSQYCSLKEFKQQVDAQGLKAYLDRHYPGAIFKSVYEAGFCGFGLHRQLSELGIDNIVVNPADVPTTDKERRRKSDRVDCRKLAASLRSGELEGIYIPSPEQEQDRQLVRLRINGIRRNYCRVSNRLKMFLHYTDGIEVPADLKEGRISTKLINWLKDLDLQGQSLQDKLDLLIEEVEMASQLRLKAQQRIRQLSDQAPYADLVELLCKIPGIGLLSAMVLITELMDIKRFTTLDRLCSYCGLVPDISATGDKEKSRGMTKRGNSYLNWVLNQAAWTAMRQDPGLALAYNKYRQRMKACTAIIRVEKKLLSRIRYVWANRCAYEHGLA